MIVVSDTGPLITWSRAEQLPLLQQIFREVRIPAAVAAELKPAGSPRPGSELLQSSWVQTHQAAASPLVLPAVLGPGEREAIALAHQSGLPLLIDDQAGKKAAEAAGIPVLTTLRVLAQCKRLQFVDQVEPILRRMVAEGFYLSPATVETFLDQVGG